nr:MAG TPA: hypothetical protein [Microviridae sp.]
MAATLDEHGREWLDQTPVEIPIPFTRPEPIHLRLRRIVEQYHQEMKDANEYETFDDADDFEVGDNVPSYEDKPTEYEQDFMPSREVVKKLFPERTAPKEQPSPAAPDGVEPPQAAPKA